MYDFLRDNPGFLFLLFVVVTVVLTAIISLAYFSKQNYSIYNIRINKSRLRPSLYYSNLRLCINAQRENSSVFSDKSIYQTLVNGSSDLLNDNFIFMVEDGYPSIKTEKKGES